MFKRLQRRADRLENHAHATMNEVSGEAKETLDAAEELVGFAQDFLQDIREDGITIRIQSPVINDLLAKFGIVVTDPNFLTFTIDLPEDDDAA